MYSYLVLEGQYGRDEMVMVSQVQICAALTSEDAYACNSKSETTVWSQQNDFSIFSGPHFVAVVTPVTPALIFDVLPSGRPSFYFRVRRWHEVFLIFRELRLHHHCTRQFSCIAVEESRPKRQSKQPSNLPSAPKHR